MKKRVQLRSQWEFGEATECRRGLMRGMGYSDEELRRPIIGIVNSWNEFNPGHVHLRELARRVKERLELPMLRLHDAGRPIRRVALCAGSGGSFLPQVLAAGADAYITGDVKHNQAVDAANAGLTLIDAGHYETEAIILEPARQFLQERFPAVEFRRAMGDRALFRYF